MDSHNVDKVISEKKILRNLQSPFCVKLFYAFQTKTLLFLVLNFVQGGELHKHRKEEKQFHESEARFFTGEILLALIHLHSHNIFYRDLKPENILIGKDGHIQVTDFGLAKQLKTSNARTDTVCGTPEYMAPEIVMEME